MVDTVYFVLLLEYSFQLKERVPYASTSTRHESQKIDSKMSLRNENVTTNCHNKSEQNISYVLYTYRPQTKFGRGNIFTGVCLSTGGCVASTPPPPQSRHPPPKQTPPGQTPHTHTQKRRPLKRVVCILLECFLVPWKYTV